MNKKSEPGLSRLNDYHDFRIERIIVYHRNQMNQSSDNGWQSLRAATRNLVEVLRYE